MSVERNEADRQPLSPELKAVEALLGTLRPAAVAIDRDRVMYEAGAAAARQASGRSGAALRRAATGVAVAASLLCGVWIGNRSARETLPQAARPERAHRELESPHEATAPRDDARIGQFPADSYAQLRRRIVAVDVEFPSPASTSDEIAPDAAPWLPGRADLLRLMN